MLVSQVECCKIKGTTYPNVIVALYKLRVPKQAPLQHGLQESQVDHVEQQQTQNGQVHYDGKLKIRNNYCGIARFLVKKSGVL